MIPLILEFKNFLSYGEKLQRIDLSEYNLICLSGKNGHGKSALLDAITWAVWGQARKIHGAQKADEGLVRLGQTHMMASLEFSVSDKRYRVRREFTKSYGKPLAALDFELFDPMQQAFISLTDKTIRATQKKIDGLIGIDYETFINTAFLRQGQSNEFSKKSAKERKQILTTILGLEKYDELQQLALTKTRTISEQRRVLSTILEQHAKDLSQEPIIGASLAQHNQQLVTLAANIDAIEKNLKQMTQVQTTYLTQKSSLITHQNELNDKKNILQASLTIFKNRLIEWKNIHRQSLHVTRIDALQEEKKLLLEQEKKMRIAQQKRIEVQEKILLLKSSLHNLCMTRQQEYEKTLTTCRLTLQQHELLLSNQQTKLTFTINQHNEMNIKKTALEKEITEQSSILAQNSNIEQTLSATKTQFEKRRAFYQSYSQKGNWLKTQLDELEHKQKAIHNTSNPACPLCEQLLTVKRKQFLAQQFSEAESLSVRQFKRISQILTALKPLLIDQHTTVQKLQQQADDFKQRTMLLHEKRTILAETTHILEQLAHEHVELLTSINRYRESLEQSKKNLNDLAASFESQLAQDTDLIAIKKHIDSLEKENQTLTFDIDGYQRLQEKISALDHNITQYQNLQQSALLQEDRRNTLRLQAQELKALKKNIISLEEKTLDGATLSKKEEVLKHSINEKQASLLTLTTEKEHLLQAIGSLEHEKKRFANIHNDVIQKNQTIEKLNREFDDYNDLTVAFGKNGIQALLIEEAIPEIEHEANALLSKLTDNQAHIFIASLRDLKSGGVKETLDIQIADAAGIRPYEMYSGGEAFRVDFALRIAIAKLLARRAGTSLQTLIIDEGFGSQDEEGLAHIMDALYAIQHDFSKIIVVSHLPEFKHNFPVHFIVEKGPLGSQVHIQERG